MSTLCWQAWDRIPGPKSGPRNARLLRQLPTHPTPAKLTTCDSPQPQPNKTNRNAVRTNRRRVRTASWASSQRRCTKTAKQQLSSHRGSLSKQTKKCTQPLLRSAIIRTFPTTEAITRIWNGNDSKPAKSCVKSPSQEKHHSGVSNQSQSANSHPERQRCTVPASNTNGNSKQMQNHELSTFVQIFLVRAKPTPAGPPLGRPSGGRARASPPLGEK